VNKSSPIDLLKTPQGGWTKAAMNTIKMSTEDQLHDQLRECRAERDALATRLRGSPEMRETIGALKQMLRDLDDGLPEMSRRRLERLLRRLDIETTEQTK
jgi:hypothetical protein